MQKQEAMIMEQDKEGIYLYCLARSGPDLAAGGQDRDLDAYYMHEYKGIIAVLDQARLDDFCGQDAEKRLMDPSWVLPRIIRHEKVIEEIMTRSQVIPARFATMFSSLARIEELLRVNEETIKHFFDQTTGMAEWAVKGTLDRELARDTVCADLMAKESARISSLPPGKRYFEEKRIQQHVDSGIRNWIREISRSICRALLDHAWRICERNPPARGRGDDPEVIFNWAFLVPDDSLGRFHDQVIEYNDRYAGRGLTIQAGGPWPLYSFAPVLSLDEDQ